MECHENGRTMWWKSRGLLEVTIIELGQDGKNYNDPCWVLLIPSKGGVGRIGGVVALLFLFILFIVCRLRVWLKGTSTKASWFTLEKASSIILSFNFPFPLEMIFCFSTSTYVLAKLARISMKEGSILFFKGISRVVVLALIDEMLTTLEKMETSQYLNKSF